MAYLWATVEPASASEDDDNGGSAESSSTNYGSTMDVTRIYTGDDGESHFEDLTVDMVDNQLMGLISDPWTATAVQFREVGSDYKLDFHNAPRRQLVVNLTGSVEVEVKSGEKRTLGPGSILLAEDTTGRGHISRNGGSGPRTCLFIHLGD